MSADGADFHGGKRVRGGKKRDLITGVPSWPRVAAGRRPGRRGRSAYDAPIQAAGARPPGEDANPEFPPWLPVLGFYHYF